MESNSLGERSVDLHRNKDCKEASTSLKMYQEYIHLGEEIDESKINTSSYMKLNTTLGEIKSFITNKINTQNRVIEKDLDDAEYSKWLEHRSFASGLVTPKDYQDINKNYDPSSKIQVRSKDEFYQRIKEIFQNFVYLGTKRYSASCYQKVHDFLKEEAKVEDDKKFQWLLVFANSVKNLEDAPIGLISKVKAVIEQSEHIQYQDIPGSGSSKNLIDFKKQREVFRRLIDSLKFDKAQTDPEVYECLCAMSKNYNSGYHLLQASRTLVSSKMDEHKQYLYHEDMLGYKLDFFDSLEKIISDSIKEYEMSSESDTCSEISSITFNPDLTYPAPAEESKSKKKDGSARSDSPSATPIEEENKIMDIVFSDCKDDKSISEKLRGKHYAFGRNDTYFYFYLEGFGVYKICGDKVVARSRCKELKTGTLSFVFLNRSSEPCIRRSDDIYTKNLPFLSVDENLELTRVTRKLKREYADRQKEYKEKDIQCFESTHSADIFAQSDKDRVRFMRATPLLCEKEMIYALSSTVEIDKNELSPLINQNLWENTDKWVKKICHWELHGYDVTNLKHQFKLELNGTIEQELKDKFPDRLLEYESLEKEVAQNLRLDTIQRAILSFGSENLIVCFDHKIYFFSLETGHLQPDTREISENILGYSYENNNHWHLEKAVSGEGLTIKPLTIKKVECKRIEFVQRSLTHFIKKQIITSKEQQKLSEENIQAILDKVTLDEDKQEQDTLLNL
ncbi:unnamed protein product [Moneuplotes crassus]|uniref:Uncharacterized protein n=1 Tax=Euplotes crassus TaxID=5936 RepID=A0AAD1XVD8_EUPCR|nr:unnamed protein product [Moneuplotes crassus]